jgi:hypothetical protein
VPDLKTLAVLKSMWSGKTMTAAIHKETVGRGVDEVECTIFKFDIKMVA